MGFSPREVDAMSLWQFIACVDGWNAAHGGDDGGDGPPSAEEFERGLKALGWD